MYLVTFTHLLDEKTVTHLLLLTDDPDRAVSFMRVGAVELVRAAHYSLIDSLPSGPGPWGFGLHRLEPETPMPIRLTYDSIPGTVVLRCWRNTFSDRNRLLIEEWHDEDLASRFR